MKTEQILNKAIPSGKVYEEWKVCVGTFIGGPLIAGYMMANNFRRFGDVVKGRVSWICAITVFLLILGGGYLIPKDIHIPKHLIPVVYTTIAYFFARYYCSKKIDRFLDNEADRTVMQRIEQSVLFFKSSTQKTSI